MEQDLNILQQWIDQYSELLYNGKNSLGKEYKTLRSEGSRIVADTEEHKRTVGSIAKNRAKNRYRDIIPFDDTRVKLSEIAEIPYSDYINANFVQGIYGTNAYIASQAPLPHTANDFWRMIWEVNVKVVLMACNETEGNKPKCSRYWPDDYDTDMTFETIIVTLTSVDVRDDGELLVRRLQAERDGVRRTIMQYHYTAWPDHGVPQNMLPILDMLTSARTYQPNDEPPMVVHCSAGCGRTGTLLAIDYIRNLLKEGKITNDLDVLDILIIMRKQRQSLIQTPEQYETVYRAVVELFQQKINTQENHLYENLSTNDQVSRKQRTKKSIKESSAIAQDFLSSLSAEKDGLADSVGSSAVGSDIVQDKSNHTSRIILNGTPTAPRKNKNSRHYKAEYVNAEVEIAIKQHDKSTDKTSDKSADKSAEKSLGATLVKSLDNLPEKPAKPKPSATISLGQPEVIGKRPPPDKPVIQPRRPSVPAKPNRKSIRLDLSGAATYSLADGHAEQSSPVSPKQLLSANDPSASKPALKRKPRPKLTHHYSEVELDVQNPLTSGKSETNNNKASEATQYSLAREVTEPNLHVEATKYDLAEEITEPELGLACATKYHLAGQTDNTPTTNPGKTQANGFAEEEYSYADIGGRLQREMQKNCTSLSYSLAGEVASVNSSGSSAAAQSEYSLADEDDDGVAPPPLPMKTDEAFIHGQEEYSPVEFKSGGDYITRDNKHSLITVKKSATLSPGKHFKNLLKSKGKTLGAVTHISAGSSMSSTDEIMYRGINMAYPNKMKGLDGEKSMPLSFKR